MTRAVLSIGGNLGGPAAVATRLRAVRAHYADRLLAASGLVVTAPWGGVEQDDFLNAILVVEDAVRDPLALLHEAQELERRARRVRGVRWGPRTLDIDLVTCIVDGHEVGRSDPELTLPHPRAHERAFVLLPWVWAQPEARLRNRPVAEWVSALPAAERDGLRPATGTVAAGWAAGRTETRAEP